MIRNLAILMGIALCCCCGCTKKFSRSEVSLTREEICSKCIQVIKEKCPELRPIGTGGGVRDGKITLLGITFKVETVLHLDSARNYIVRTGEEMLRVINSNEEYRDWFQDNQASPSNFDLTIIGQASDNHSNNYIYWVSICGGQVCYFVENEDFFGATLTHEETFIEAQKRVQEQL